MDPSFLLWIASLSVRENRQKVDNNDKAWGQSYKLWLRAHVLVQHIDILTSPSDGLLFSSGHDS
jgi:hypothetical protein